MALFHFKKKQAEQQAPACACSCSCGEPAGDAVQSTNCCPEAQNTNGCCSETQNGIYSIKVLGAGCKSCHVQYENAKAAAAKRKIPVEVEYITDLQKIMGYGVMSMPALVVNKKVVSAGRLLDIDEIAALLNQFGA
ncbi:MAG: thioredoxin family protein [bacterium]|nr:thioredoxin family protein [bacterium]